MSKLLAIVRDQPSFMAAFDAQAAAFTSGHPDVEIERVSPGIEACYERFVTGPSEADLLLAVTDWIPELAASGRALNLAERLRDDPPQDWPNGWHAAMRGLIDWNGGTYALPYHDGPQVLHYRADLFESPLEQSRFRAEHGRDLVPPNTWSEFLEVARFFSRDGLWGCCLGAAPDGHNNVYDFLVHLWSRRGELDDLSSEQAIDALEFLVGLVRDSQVAAPECLAMNSVESGDYYASGKAAMMWNWVGYAATAEGPASTIKGLNRVARMPSGDGLHGRSVSLNVFWAMTMLSTCREPDLAWSFMKRLATPEMDLLTVQHGASGVRLSTWDSPSVRAEHAYYGLLASIHDGSRSLPLDENWPKVHAALNRMSRDAMSGLLSPRAALVRAAEEMR